MEEAVGLLALVGAFIADRCVWTRHARAAQGYRHRREKVYPNGFVREERWDLDTMAPTDPRACRWSVLGALELAAEDPDGLDVVFALELLRRAGRGWAISRVEEEEGHTGAVWVLAVAVAKRPGVRLAPRLPKSEVDLTLVQRAEKDADASAPATMRSSELRLRSRRRRAA